MSIADRPKMIAVGGACATSIYRVDTVPSLPAKAIANALCRVADGMAISAACGFTRLGGEAAVWARVGDDVARWAAGAAAALGWARAHGIPTMLDGDVAPREVLARLVPLADFAVFSDAGLLAYTAASLKCTRFGGRIGCPTRAEVDAALAGQVVG